MPDTPDALHKLVVVPAEVQQSILTDWQMHHPSLQLVSSLSERVQLVDKVVQGGTLVRRMQFALQSDEQRYTRAFRARGWRRRKPVSSLVGCAEMLLVRRPVKPPLPPHCRICMDDNEEGCFDEDDTLNRAVMVALMHDEAEPVRDSELPCGRLLRDVCACRGSAAAVHEGCLIAWLTASGALDRAHACRECRQPFVGRASLVLARLHQRLKCVQAAAAAEHAARTEQSGVDQLEAALAAQAADVQALAALEARHNEAVSVWHAGRFQEAAQMFAALLSDLEVAATEAASKRGGSHAEVEMRVKLAEVPDACAQANRAFRMHRTRTRTVRMWCTGCATRTCTRLP